MSIEQDDRALERALGGDPVIVPSRQFAYRVMRSVREDASHREAIAFPWRLLAGGIALSLAVGFLGAPVPEDVVSASVSDVSPRVALAAQWSALTLGGSFLLAWWAARFVRIS